MFYFERNGWINPFCFFVPCLFPLSTQKSFSTPMITIEFFPGKLVICLARRLFFNNFSGWLPFSAFANAFPLSNALPVTNLGCHPTFKILKGENLPPWSLTSRLLLLMPKCFLRLSFFTPSFFALIPSRLLVPVPFNPRPKVCRFLYLLECFRKVANVRPHRQMGDLTSPPQGNFSLPNFSIVRSPVRPFSSKTHFPGPKIDLLFPAIDQCSTHCVLHSSVFLHSNQAFPHFEACFGPTFASLKPIKSSLSAFPFGIVFNTSTQ